MVTFMHSTSLIPRTIYTDITIRTITTFARNRLLVTTYKREAQHGPLETNRRGSHPTSYFHILSAKTRLSKWYVPYEDDEKVCSTTPLNPPSPLL
jgi:hypothetical protein